MEDSLVYLFGRLTYFVGISDAQLGISEIGVGYPDSTFGEESRIGVPFIVRFDTKFLTNKKFILREILQYDYTLDDAINRMANSRRTCGMCLDFYYYLFFRFDSWSWGWKGYINAIGSDD